MTDLATLAWTTPELGTAIEALARKSGLAPRPVQVPAAPEAILQNSDAVSQWIQAAAAWLEVEAEPVAMFYHAVDQFIRSAGPALVRLRIKNLQDSSY